MKAGTSRLLGFLALYGAFAVAWSSTAAVPVQSWLIEDLTVAPAAWLIGLADPQRGALAAGAALSAAGGGAIHVRAGCEGADLAFLLISAMLCAPLAWRDRLAGLGVGLALVFALNQARVIGLFYAIGHDRALFALLHGTVLPLLLVVAVAAFFIAWLRRGAPRHPPFVSPR